VVQVIAMAPKKRAPPSPTKAETAGMVNGVVDEDGPVSVPRTNELVFLWVPNLIGESAMLLRAK
jgi:hypothetical protein